MLLYICLVVRDVNGLTAEEKVVLSLVKNGLNGLDDKIDTDCDFSQVLKILDKHAVNMIALEGAKSIVSTIPKNIYSQWMYLASRKMAKRESISAVQKKLTTVLEENNIGYFVLKGFCAASYYYKPELRECGDVDFFVNRSDFELADSCLKNSGFSLETSKEDLHHWSYFSNGVEAEMHYRIWDLPNNECGNFLKNYFDNTIENTKTYSIDNYRFNGPKPVSHAVILLLHIINHMQKGGIGLRHICDFAAFLSSSDFKDNYEEIINVFKKGGIFKFAQIVACVSNSYLGSPKYDFFEGADLELSEQFLIDVMRSGNFGVLSQDSYFGSTVFTLNKAENSVIKSIFEFCKNSWKPCGKHKILLPIAPIYVGIRYFFRMLRGKRPKINPVKFTKNGLERADLYKNLEFFKR